MACSATGMLIAAYAYAPFVNAGPVLCPMHGLIGLPWHQWTPPRTSGRRQQPGGWTPKVSPQSFRRQGNGRATSHVRAGSRHVRARP